jgi:ornithine cyclodeaminase
MISPGMISPGMNLPVLDRAAVIATGGADFPAALADVRDASALLRAGEAEMPAETSVALGSEDRAGRAYALPAGLGGRFQAAGVKWTAHRPALADGLPMIASWTIVNDRRTGLPLGIVESALLTAMRTAAVSGLALQHLMPVPLRSAAVLGAGFHARTHLEMLAALHPALERVLVWNRDRVKAEVLAAGAWPFPVIVAENPAEAATCDAILTCTNAREPILQAGDIAPGRLVVQIGYHEVSFDAIDRADHVVVDLWGEFRLKSAKSLFQMHRAGRFPQERVAADLGTVLAGGFHPEPGSLVYLSSFGLNIFDIALAARVLASARQVSDATTSGQDGSAWPWQ